MKITKAWAIETLEQGVIVFLTAFVGALALGGVSFDVGTLHAALIGAAGGVVSFLQSALANLVNPPSTNLVTALRTKNSRRLLDLS